MAEPVIVPIQLDVTDIDMSNFNPKDVQKQISSSLTNVRKSIEQTFSQIDTSKATKPLLNGMRSLENSFIKVNNAQKAFYKEAVQAGKSSEAYKKVVAELKEAKTQLTTLEKIRASWENSQGDYTGTPEMWETYLKSCEEYEAQLHKVQDLQAKVDAPSIFAKNADPASQAIVESSLRKMISAVASLNQESEKFNRTIEDSKVSDEYAELLKQAEAYKKKLADLNEKSKEMEFKGATDKQWENLRKDTEWTSMNMDEVIKKMRTAVNTGRAFRFGEGSKKEFSNQINSFGMSARNNAGYVVERAQKNQSPYTEDYQKALDDLDKLEKKIEAIKEKSAKMMELGASKKQFETLAYDAENLDIKVDEVKNHLMSMVNEGKAFRFGNGNAETEIGQVRDKANGLQSALSGVVTGAKKAQGGLTAIGATNPKLAAVLTVVSSIAVGFGKVLSASGKAAKTIATGFGAVVKTLGKVVSYINKMVSNFFGRKATKTHNAGMSNLTRNIMMFGLGFRTAYYAVKRLRNIFTEGLKAMGDSFDEVGEPMKALIESFNRLKGSLVTAFQPIVSVVMPILTNLMNRLSGILEAIGKFNAALTGQKYIYKAVAKEVNSVAGAAKNANKQLASYDKLEVIKDDNAGYDYEKTGIDTSKESTDAATDFANMVKEAWEKADFTSVGAYVTEKLLDVLEVVETNVVPKAVDFVNRLLTSVNTFFEGFDATAIGDKFGSIINAVLTGVDWEQVGMFFSTLYNEVWQFFNGLFSSIDWELLGQSLNTGLISLVTTLDYNSLAGMVTGLTMGILTAVQQIDWAQIMEVLLGGLQTILQTLGTEMASSDNPIIAGFGSVILAISEAIDSLRPAVESIISAISPIVQSILPVISQLLPPIADIISQAVVMVMPVLVKLFEAVMPILGQLIQILMPLFMDLLVSLQPIFDALINTILPVIVHLLDAVMPLVKGLLGLITNLLAPILSLLGPLLEIVFNILDPVITILEPILDVLGVLCDVIGAVLRPILDAITPILSTVSAIFELLGPVISWLITPLAKAADQFKFIAGLITGTVVPALDIVMGVIEVVMNVFTMLANTVKFVFALISLSLEETVQKTKNKFNAILTFVEVIANGIIKAVNGMVKAMNKLSFDVPEWVPGIGGKKFGFNLKEISEIRIPRLAQGAVIPPNKEFLAMLGDQKHGTNIEAPLDTIKQALAEVLAEMGGGNKEPIILQVNGRTLAKVVWDEQEKHYKQTGRYAMA